MQGRDIHHQLSNYTVRWKCTRSSHYGLLSRFKLRYETHQDGVLQKYYSTYLFVFFGKNRQCFLCVRSSSWVVVLGAAGPGNKYEYLETVLQYIERLTGRQLRRCKADLNLRQLQVLSWITRLIPAIIKRRTQLLLQQLEYVLYHNLGCCLSSYRSKIRFRAKRCGNLHANKRRVLFVYGVCGRRSTGQCAPFRAPGVSGWPSLLWFL